MRPDAKRRPQGAFWSIVLVVVAVLLGTVAFIRPWARDKRELVDNTSAGVAAGNTNAAGGGETNALAPAAAAGRCPAYSPCR